MGLVSSAAAHGDYTKNPYHFQTFQCNYVGFYVNGQSTPSQPLQPNYDADNFVDAYSTIHPRDKQRAVQITREDYKNGYCLYMIDTFGNYDRQTNRLPQRGHTRLQLNFGTALPETCTVIVYAKFSALMSVDERRKVTLT